MKNKKIVLFNFLLDIFLFCVFLFLVLGNLYVSFFIPGYCIDLLNFIALEFFNEKRFYVLARGIGTGLYVFAATLFALCAMTIYGIFCYWLYSKRQGWKYFLIIFAIFVAYFFIFCQVFPNYRLMMLLFHFPIFWLTYIEIILLYRIRDKLLK